MSVIVSVWGDPAQWDPVRYYVEDMRSGDFKLLNRKYKSTLGALMEFYSDAKVLLFVASTLVRFSGKVFERYREVVDDVVSNVNEYLKSGDYCMDSERVELRVLPGIGRFKPKSGNEAVNFIGNINAFRVATSISAYEFICRVKPETLILDISHGVNYMPVYVRQSVYDAFNAYVALNGRSARWVVYNSEPFSKDVNVEDLQLNIVEDFEVNAVRAREHLYNDFESLYIDGNFKPYKPDVRGLESIREWRRLNEQTIRFVKFSIMGQIIPLIETMRELIRFEREKLMSELKRYSYLEDCDDIVKITSDRKSLNVQYLHAPQYQTTLMMFIKDIVEKLSDREIVEAKNGYEIEGLGKITEKFIREPGKTLIKNELFQIEERTELCRELQLKLNEWVLYRAITEVSERQVEFEGRKTKLITVYRNYKDKKVEEDKFKEIIMREREGLQKDVKEFMKVKSIDKRNFIAHASLEGNVTLISIRDGKIYVKYSQEKAMRNQLEKILGELIKQSSS
jgi:CRISPR-associated protein Csx1